MEVKLIDITDAEIRQQKTKTFAPIAESAQIFRIRKALMNPSWSIMKT